MMEVSSGDEVKMMMDHSEKLNKIASECKDFQKLLSLFEIETVPRTRVKHYPFNDTLKTNSIASEIDSLLMHMFGVFASTLISEIQKQVITKYGDEWQTKLQSEKPIGKILMAPALTFRYTGTECNGFQMYASSYLNAKDGVVNVSGQVNFAVELTDDV